MIGNIDDVGLAPGVTPAFPAVAVISHACAALLNVAYYLAGSLRVALGTPVRRFAAHNTGYLMYQRRKRGSQ